MDTPCRKFSWEPCWAFSSRLPFAPSDAAMLPGAERLRPPRPWGYHCWSARRWQHAFPSCACLPHSKRASGAVTRPSRCAPSWSDAAGALALVGALGPGVADEQTSVVDFWSFTGLDSVSIAELDARIVPRDPRHDAYMDRVRDISARSGMPGAWRTSRRGSLGARVPPPCTPTRFSAARLLATCRVRPRGKGAVAARPLRIRHPAGRIHRIPRAAQALLSPAPLRFSGRRMWYAAGSTGLLLPLCPCCRGPNS